MWALTLSSLFLSAPCHSFEGSGECSKLVTDYAYLLKKSVFLPHSLSGNCVISSEKHFPLIMKNAGFNYKETASVISLTEVKPYIKPEFKAPKKEYLVNFAFLNTSSLINCGLTLDDVLASFKNLHFDFSVAGVFGCPALDKDGSFAFSVNAALNDSWSYTHGVEEQRAESQITASTGAVTTQYRYITTGLDIALNQRENGVFYSLRYTSRNGNITTSSGAVVDLVQSDITEVFKTKRKLWIIPLGYEDVENSYKLILQVKERNR